MKWLGNGYTKPIPEFSHVEEKKEPELSEKNIKKENNIIDIDVNADAGAGAGIDIDIDKGNSKKKKLNQ